MGENTNISWCDHTFNLVIGCVKVSPGCENCYAETLAHDRMGLDVWGPAKTTGRHHLRPAYWRQPLRWNRQAEEAGQRRRVFCGSMCDWAEDHPDLIEPRKRLVELWRETPWLDWLMLTKRPERIAGLLPDDWGATGYPNVWLGTSVENQAFADLRIPHLVKVPAVVRFLSCEPLIGPIDLGRSHPCGYYCDPDEWGGGHHDHEFWSHIRTRINWVIVGGESGKGFREMKTWWAEDLRDQCARAQVAFFFKQDNGTRPGANPDLLGQPWKEFPTPWPHEQTR